MGLRQDEVIEIARFVIHPSYQAKNLASWTLARFKKWAADKYKAIVAFSDEGLHSGTIYKSVGFENLGCSRDSDYEYRDNDGFRLHKKTVWDHAKKNGVSETQFAESAGLMKVTISPRRKFLFRF